MTDLKRIVIAHSNILQKKAPWLDARAALGALLEVESSFGVFNHPRYEKGYGPGGSYFEANKDNWLKYGSWAACSYSSWQIMFTTAVELGFRGRPIDLAVDSTAIYWVMEYIDKRILSRGCKTIEEFADGYNSGSFKDRNIPVKYIEDFKKSYADVVERRGLNNGG